MSIAPASGYYRQHHYKPFNLDMVALVPFHLMPLFLHNPRLSLLKNQ